MNARIALSLTAVGVIVGLSVFARADAPAGRYTITNGTVYDTKTKLTWQQAMPSSTYTWADAQTYCSGLMLAGAGWRLPTLKELLTIVDESRMNPSVDPKAFPSTPSDFFWSLSTVGGSTGTARDVFFGDGSTNTYNVTSSFYVRCVR